MKAQSSRTEARSRYSLPELKRLAREIVELHLGVHAVLDDHPLTFLECLAQELREWLIDGSVADVMVRLLPEVDQKTCRMVQQLTTAAWGGLAPL